MREQQVGVGQLAYEAYCADSGGVSLVSGQRLPGWDALPENIQRAWTCAADAVWAREVEPLEKRIAKLEAQVIQFREDAYSARLRIERALDVARYDTGGDVIDKMVKALKGYSNG